MANFRDLQIILKFINLIFDHMKLKINIFGIKNYLSLKFEIEQ